MCSFDDLCIAATLSGNCACWVATLSLPLSLLKTGNSGTLPIVSSTLTQQQIIKTGDGTEHLAHHLSNFHHALHMLRHAFGVQGCSTAKVIVSLLSLKEVCKQCMLMRVYTILATKPATETCLPVEKNDCLSSCRSGRSRMLL